jgi:hypothetical protein
MHMMEARIGVAGSIRATVCAVASILQKQSFAVRCNPQPPAFLSLLLFLCWLKRIVCMILD